MSDTAWAFLAAGIGAVGAAFSAAFGISQIARATVESIARQPEATEDIRSVMIITASMIEGVALLAAVICFLLIFR
jgi:F-type H+-transporting ATPase subunit c